MKSDFDTIKVSARSDLAGLPAESRDVIVVSTWFDPRDKFTVQAGSDAKLAEDSVSLLEDCAHILKFDGLIFIYGAPRNLALWGEHLSRIRDGAQEMIFKYWIVLDIDAAPSAGSLRPTHLGLLMFLKSRAGQTKPPSFRLNTDTVRIPHAQCAACGQTLKDWGGKKHLMNPKGAALSDVWRDLPRRTILDSIIPKDVLARVSDLSRAEGGSCLHVIQVDCGTERSADKVNSSQDCGGTSYTSPQYFKMAEKSGTRVTRPSEYDVLRRPQVVGASLVGANQILETDCISFLEKVAASHPEGLFDLAFADPPYNLQKLYGSYEDALAEHRYIEWCNAWLDGMARTLKPGGSLFVLNLPKWAVHHAVFLNRHLEFRHWIVWDALSDPRGKLMPAHYALLYYTKPGGKPVFNYAAMSQSAERCSEFRLQAATDFSHPDRLKAELQTEAAANGEFVLPPDSPKYCLRASCVKERKRRHDDAKVELSDVWFDIHRIKHKRDRDAHPCQLPEKLMDRIIRLTTHRGGWVFDPFCGAGTTAIAATKLGRNFVVTDVDPDYVRITREKLAAMRENADLFGSFTVPRNSVKKPKRAASKREVELYLQSLAKRLGRALAEEDIQTDNADMLRKIDSIYPNRGAALKRAKVALSA